MELETMGEMKRHSGKIVKAHIIDLAAKWVSSQAASTKINSRQPQRQDEVEQEALQAFRTAEKKDSYRLEYWTIGEQISLEQYEKVKDHESGDLYIILMWQAPNVVGSFGSKEKWDEAKRMIENE